MKIEDFNGFLKFKEETYPFSFSKNKITIRPHSIDKWNELFGEWFKILFISLREYFLYHPLL